jgi:hypothetical protein
MRRERITPGTSPNNVCIQPVETARRGRLYGITAGLVQMPPGR